MNEDRQIKKIIKQLRKSVKSHDKQADTLEKKLKEESNPRIPRKKGQPANSKKHSDLYTDENPKGTIHGLGFKDVATAKASVSKIRNSSRSHAHKIQAAVAMEQRAREMGKTSEAAVYRKFINSMKKKTKAMKEEFEKVGDIAKRIGEKTKERSKINKDYFNQYKDDVDAVKKLNNEEKELNEEGLRAWFGKSRSKGGKPGWVQVVSGKPCARQPGQKSTPKCVSSAKRASMSDAERKSAQRRKRKADPNQRFKSGAAKPTYVRTDSKRKMKVKEEMHSDWKNEISLNEMEEKKYKVKKLKPNYKHQRYAGSMKFVPDSKVIDLPNKIENEKEAAAKDKYEKGKKAFRTGQKQVPESVYSDWKNEELVLEVKDKKGKGSGKKDACYHKVKSRYSVWPSAYASGALVKCRKKGAANWGNSTKKESVEYIDEISKKTLGSYVKKASSDLARNAYDAGGGSGPDKRKSGRDKTFKRHSGIMKATDKLTKESFHQFQEKCWKGYEKKGMKTMFGKRYPNCVKKTKKEEVEVDTSSNIKEAEELKNKNINYTTFQKDGKKIHKVNKNDEADAQAAMKNDPKYILGKTRVQPYKEGYSKNSAQQAAIAIAKKEKQEGDMVAKAEKKQKIKDSYDWRSQLESELGRVDECWKTHKKVGMKMKGGKLVPNCVPKNEEVQLEAKSPAWQRKAGKSESGGLNAKGVASYRAANPGSKLKTAVTTKPSKLKKGSKAANRRKSFCARMKGMKKRLTSAKTARDPDSRINKSLRKWNC